MAQDEIVKTVRIRGKVSMKGSYWKPDAQKEDSTGENDFKLTVTKRGRKDWLMQLERIGKTGYSANDISTFYSIKIGPGEEIKTVDDLVQVFLASAYPDGGGINKLKTLKSTDDYNNVYSWLSNDLGGYGKPFLKSFIDFYAEKKAFTDVNTDTKFFEIIQDPFDETVVPTFPSGYFDIWNEWNELHKKWKEDIEKNKADKKGDNPQTETVESASGVNLEKPYIFDVSKENILISADFGTFSLKGEGLVERDFEFTDTEFDDNTSDEYTESEFGGSQESILPEAEINEAAVISEQDAKRVEEEQKKADQKSDSSSGSGDDGNAYKKNDSNSSYTVKGPMPVESTKVNSGGKVQFGFNGVPYYTQADTRWADVLYGWVVSGSDKMFIEQPLPKSAINDAQTKATAQINAKSDQGQVTTFKLKIDATEYTFKAYIHAGGGTPYSSGEYGWSTIHGGGCGITSLSMVINYWEKKMGTARWVSPIKTAKIACEHGFRDKINAKGGYPPDAWSVSKNAPSGSSYGSPGGQKLLESEFSIKYKAISKKDIDKYLSKGWPVIIQVSNLQGKNSSGEKKGYKSGHYMVLTGMDYLKQEYGITSDPVNTLIYRNNDPGTPKGPTYFSKKDIDDGRIVGFHVFYPKSKNADNPDDVRIDKLTINV